MESAFKNWWQSKAIWSGLLATIAGILQTSYGATFSPDVQSQIINVVFGLVGILAGGGSIYGRVVAAIPIATKAAKLIAELRKELNATRAALASVQSASPPAVG